MKTVLIGTFLLACVGCANPMLITRPVQDEPSLLVGLASYNNSGKSAPIQHNQPREWSEADLHGILSRLMVQKQGGIMDPSSQPQAVFSTDEIFHLTPALRETFKVAQPSDWVVFASWGASRASQTLEVTSGGMFLQDQRLHFILSNHRERVSSEREGIEGIRNNPFHSLSDSKKGMLTFDPTRYMIDSRDTWMTGGYESPASEVIVDLKALLSTDPFSTSLDPGKQTPANSSGTSISPGPSTKTEVGKLKDEIANLKEELSRLQHLMTQQAEELSRQKRPTPPPSSP